MPSSIDNVKVSEFSLRLVIPFSFDKPIENVKRYFTSLTISDLSIDSDSSPFNVLLRKSIPNNDSGIQKEKSEITNNLIRPIKIENLEKLNASSIWEQSEHFVSEDLYPHIRDILMSSPEEKSLSLQMTIPAWQLLNGGYGNKGKGLGLTLSKTSRQRIGTEEEFIPISFYQNDTPPTLHLYGFGLGALVLEVGVQDSFKNKYGITAIKEALHQLSRAKPGEANITWILRDFKAKADTALPDKTYLKTLFSHFLGVSTDKYQKQINLIEDSRFFSFSALRLSVHESSVESPNITSSELEKLAYSLAHRQTDHYKPNSSQFQKHVFMPYENIAYGMSTEGGSVIINTAYKDNSDEVVHNSNFIRDTLKKAYWPMLLLSYMEFRHLVYLTSKAAPYHQDLDSDENVIKDLEKQREKILQFRLYYRYSQASQINNHNQFYGKWRETFGSDKLSQELSDDITQINSLLNYKADRLDQLANEKQNRIFTVVGIFATTILSVVGLFGTNFVEFNNEQLTLTSDFTIYIMIGGVLTAFLICLGYYLITKHIKE